MDYHSYDKTTGEYLGTRAARVDPEEKSKFLIPASSTTEELPVTGDNEAAVFQDSEWSVVADYRGQEFYDESGIRVVITDLGVQPAEIWTEEEPAPSLEVVIVSKQHAVMALYNDKVAAGFVYETNTYQINTNSRLDMTAVMTDFVAGATNAHGGFWRSQDNQMIAMDDTEVQAFILAVKAYMAGLYQAQWTHKDAIGALQDVAAVDAYDITTGWPTNA